LIYETKNYKVVTGQSDFVQTGPDTKPTLYLIVNKETNIVEAENRVLGQTITWCRHMQNLYENSAENKADALVEIPDAGPPTMPLG
jgi:hypothetical protein